MVGDEPIRRPEHREEKNDERFEADSFPEADDFGLPGWVLHKNDVGPVWTDNIGGIAQEKSKTGTGKHKDDEGDVRSIRDCLVGSDMDIFTKRDL